MFNSFIELYIMKMESIKIIKEAIEKNVPNTVSKEINKYTDAILMDFYFNQLLTDKIDRKLEEYVGKYITVNEFNKDEKRVIYKFNKENDNLDKKKDVKEARKTMDISYHTLATMYNNVLISILIEFENIISSIFKKIITRYPDAYLGESNVSYAKIINARDIDEIKNKIIDSEVDSIMRENIFDWIKLLQNKHKIKIQFENIYVKEFIEAYLRRNIIVHNDSKINADYINGMKKIGIEIQEKEIGARIVCSKNYIKKIIDASTFFIIYIINQIIKLFSEENDTFNNSIINLGFDKIKEEEYDFAREIHRLLKDKESLDNQTKVYSLINYWQTYKWSGRYEEVREEIEKFDISAYEDLIKIAVYALRDDYSNISDLLMLEFNDDKQNGELALALEDFPVFKGLRRQKFYHELKEKYPGAFSIKSAEIKEEKNNKKEILTKEKGKYKIVLNIVPKDIDENKE